MWFAAQGRWDAGDPRKKHFGRLDEWLINTDQLAQVSRTAARGEVFLYPAHAQDAEGLMLEGAEAARVWELLQGLLWCPVVVDRRSR